MLPKIHRLHASAEIQQVLRHGKRVQTPYFRVHWRSGSTKKSRAATVVSKKISRSAVRRHHYQRWLRQVASAVITESPAQSTSYDMVFVAQPRITEVTSLLELREKVLPVITNALT